MSSFNKHNGCIEKFAVVKLTLIFQDNHICTKHCVCCNTTIVQNTLIEQSGEMVTVNDDFNFSFGSIYNVIIHDYFICNNLQLLQY